ncbi:MAG TPA: L-type lectin-domain containing protein, partial [Acidobacteriaceae bacterium]|nr:L-type lectin-domain containing protein [Acidobacteriaceae bacterium]
MYESKRNGKEGNLTTLAFGATRRVARMVRRLAFPIASTILVCAIAVSGSAQVNVTTFHNDIGRTGQNLNETILTPANVKSGFGKLFSQTVDGQVYAQPLYLSGVTINGAKHNVVYVATENDSVYAFDADTNGGSNSSPLWMASMLASAHGAGAGAQPIPYLMVSSDIQPIYGITGTPVIDVTTKTMYVVSKTYESSKIYQRLHALDVTTGAEKFGGPVTLQASVPGSGNGSVNGVLSFDPQWENQRPGLLLLNGIVWIGFASHGDNGPWHGWILGYNAATLQQTGAYCTSPNGAGSGIWMSGGGLAADQLDPVNKPYGRMFIPTGNGDFTATKPYTNSMDYGDSEVVLDLTNGVPTVTDDFTTYQQASFNAEDGDIASGGMLLLPNQSGTYPHLAAQVGKQGWMYVMNRDNMGGYSTTGDSIAQEIQWAVGGTGAWSSAAYWNGNVYWWGKIDPLKQFPITNGVLSTNPIKSTETYGFPGATPSISANGNTNGIVWSIDTENNMSGPAVLQAHDATNVATTLYSSSNSSNDTAGLAVKFATPTIANGKVYVGAGGEIDIYGLRTTPTVATPVISPGSQIYSGTLSVTITDTTSGSTIYYTTDGTTPTTSSTVYTGPILVTASETITAVASASGYVNSATTSATFTNTAAVPVVTFSLPTGTYNSAQSLTLSDSQGGAKIYYTTNGTTPTTSSTLYTGPITITNTETITAIAAVSGMVSSTPLAQSYTIALGATGIQYNTGFASSTGQVILNGSSQLNDTRLQLTDGLVNEAGSAFYYQPVSVSTFTTDFTFQLSNPTGEGITFVIQNASAGSAAIGRNGAGLGYAGIPSSLAIKFDLYSDAGEGTNSTGLYTGGATPTTPSIDLSSTGINLHSNDLTGVHVTYDGTTLRMTITDQVTGAVWSTSWTINIPSVIGANTAYVGFTGGTGTATASQKILSWSYYTIPPAATPAFS